MDGGHCRTVFRPNDFRPNEMSYMHWFLKTYFLPTANLPSTLTKLIHSHLSLFVWLFVAFWVALAGAALTQLVGRNFASIASSRTSLSPRQTVCPASCQRNC